MLFYRVVFGDPPDAYRKAITEVVQRRRQTDANPALMDGLILIGSERGLTVDLLHPDRHGMGMIANGIVRHLHKTVM